ncbi:MAG: ketoacyl-ACP synthase III [Chloroflexi bacterium]|nr:ketoacyl-ACP synthase III [Chloroflexota bacterium]
MAGPGERQYGSGSIRYACVTGWGLEMPTHIMTNSEIEASLQLEENWIYPRTGIHQRRIAAPDQTATDLGAAAAQKALDVAGISAQDVDLVIVATSTPEFIFPSTASLIQNRLGVTETGAVDVSAACSGFVYALDLATSQIRIGNANTALVIGTETMSRLMNWHDRKTCVLFGDGAGAIVLQGTDTPCGIMSSILRSEGGGWEKLVVPTVGSLNSFLRDDAYEMHRMYMDGRAVKEFAIDAIVKGIGRAADKAGLTVDDLDWIIPHQANQRILEAAADLLNYPMDRVYSNLDHYGNTSAASIPIALAEAADAGCFRPGDTLGLIGFGGGLTWGAAIVEWTGSGTTRP